MSGNETEATVSADAPPAWAALAAQPGPLRCGLLFWSAWPPAELAMLAAVLQAAAAHEPQALQFAWLPAGQGIESAPALLVVAEAPPAEASAGDLLKRLAEQALHVVLIGPAVRWFAATRWARGRRVALHWADLGAHEQLPEQVIASPAIIEAGEQWTTCCGGAATHDLALLLVEAVCGPRVRQAVQDECCLERVRAPASRQRSALPGSVGQLVPRLAEAVALMEANIEEPLQSEELAELVGMSRRQLERLFKQHLDSVPSRYYLELRLARARRLLRETRHSLLQIALMCGFSSGSHFSTSYSAVYGVTPRDERQKMLKAG
ncbi:helix-turn-helix domain-containing protein [Aquabacterium sp. A7-Y]|uniref:helix-turn-helix domain-containing protein n=1 Tax=Aquabacterium sp. A7-Y TaxID=1349605 RepID=UPI00223E5E06|nr:helix-turn-helix domain-containing protein [Aquabacterium sp. A7-Y]MCW7539752.1 helix-turn-helix domain-containing protein [Aquabacterium sp. A7-Y]